MAGGGTRDMASAKAKTLIIARNDLEAAEILALARASGEFDCIELMKLRTAGEGALVGTETGQQPLPWGDRLDPGRPELAIEALGPVVVLVEAPARGYEDAIRASGRSVVVIDHHLYVDDRGRLLDRRCPRSSLEQFAAHFGTAPLTDRQRLIAANDRGGWPAMHQAGGNAEKILEIRRQDLACRLDPATIDDLLADARRFLDTAEAQGQMRVLGCGRDNPDHPELIVVRAPDRLKAVLIDALYQSRGEGARTLEALVVYATDNGSATQVEYTGPARRRPFLDQLIADLARTSRLRIWAGGSDVAVFFGAETGEAAPADLNTLADRLLDAVLGGNRPLIRWRSQFVQLLRYDADNKAPQITAATGECFENAAVGAPVRNYLLDYMRPFFAPLPETDGTSPDGAHCMRSLAKPEPIEPWSLTIHSYQWRTDKDRPLPRFRIRWPDRTAKDGTVRGRFADERPLANLAVHFLFGGLIALEWSFQDGWPEHDAGLSLFDRLLRLPLRERDPDGYTREQNAPPADDRSAFAPWKDDNYDDAIEYPTLAFNTPHTPGVDCLAALLDFNDAARQCYASFYAPDSRKDLSLLLPPTPGQPDWVPSPGSILKFGEKTQAAAERPAGWFADLVDFALKDHFGLGRDDLTLVLDERARVITAAACVGARPTLPAAIEDQEVLFARLATVESYHPDHFYDRDFVRAEIGRARYDRFRSQDQYPDSSQLFAVTDHSLALLGHGWFAANVAIKHLAAQYCRLFLIAQLYACVFHRFGHELGAFSRRRLALDAAIARLDAEIDAKAEQGCPATTLRQERARQWQELDGLAAGVGRLKARFVAFANGLWFEDVGTQIQGHELFALMTRQLPVGERYREIEAEIARTDDLEAEDARRRDERRAKELTVLGSFIATLAAMGTAFAPILDPDSPNIGWITVPLAILAPVAVLALTRGYTARRACAEVLALGLDFLGRSGGVIGARATGRWLCALPDALSRKARTLIRGPESQGSSRS